MWRCKVNRLVVVGFNFDTGSSHCGEVIYAHERTHEFAQYKSELLLLMQRFVVVSSLYRTAVKTSVNCNFDSATHYVITNGRQPVIERQFNDRSKSYLDLAVHTVSRAASGSVKAQTTF